jgi:hypothetical protein
MLHFWTIFAMVPTNLYVSTHHLLVRRSGVHELKIPGNHMRHSSVVVLWWCLVADPHDGDYILRLLGIRVECLVLLINEALVSAHGATAAYTVDNQTYA